LTRDEMLDICANIALAGLDTLTAGLTTCMAFFALHPDKREQILERPELIESAVEELLRWESPVSAVFRRAAVDTEFDGCPIKAGEFVHVNLGAANLDPEEFPNPMQVDFGRTVNRHYAFGKGIHRCLGSHLARRVLRVSIEEWHRRIPRYRLSDNVELRYFTPTRGVGNLQLEW
jgi:cytochrome P450